MQRGRVNNRQLRLCMTFALGLSGATSACEAPATRPAVSNPMEPTAGSAGTASSATTPCQVAYGSACDAACSGDAACGAGLHCKEGKCTAECVQASDCANGKCTSDGHCDDIMLMPTETDPTPTSENPKCIEGQVEFKAVVPQVWLLLDRSGSMTSLLGTTSRWVALGTVLLGDPTNPLDRGVVGDFEKSVAFGAVFYTTGAGASGCALDLESVALAANNYVHIRQRYNKLSPSGNTPTADSIAATVAVAASSDLTGGPKILVLATDGAPGSCSPRTGSATSEVEKEVEKAFQKKIQTFAISISTGTDVPHMQRVANIGAGLAADSPTPATLYTAESQQQLKDAFSSILTEVPRSCVFELNGNVERARAGEGTVVLAGQELTFGDPDGWLLKQADQVELVGSACAQIQAGEANLDISFPCAVFTPVVK
jgi:hypothetical protein